jgi:hypothetical protein
MKKIEDYLHLYLGCECKYRTTAIENAQWGWGIVDVRTLHSVYTGLWEIQLILRPLSNMTDGEKIFIISNYIKPGWTGKQLLEDNEDDWAMRVRHIEHGEKSVYVSKKKFEPWLLKYLLSKGFDLFGLIEAGLAIETPSLLTNQVK